MSDMHASLQSASFGTLSHFLRWYWIARPMRICFLYARYASAFGAMFSIIFLLKTLVTPWKSIQDAYPSKGLNVSAILETLTLNLTARAIGMFVRIGAMLTGLILQIVLSIGFAIYLFLWITLPILALGAVVYLLCIF